MATETLIFMPNGDVTLTLTRYVLKEEDTPPNSLSDLQIPPPLNQAAINEIGLAGETGLEADALTEAEEESVLFFAPDPPGNPDGPSYPPPPRAARGSNASSRRDRSESPPASFWATLKRQSARVTQPTEEEPLTPPPAKKSERIVLSSHDVHCVVSSRHMMLASRHFQTFLSGDSSEAVTLRTTGHVTIPLQDDLETMTILLNIIHGASRKVPRQVTLEALSKLAVLVSKFEMLETVEFFSDTWIDNLQRGGLPKWYDEDVLALVFVFWVFDRPAEFKDMTRLAQRESTEKLEDHVRDIPILHSIIDSIKRDREFAIETAITVIHALIDRYMAGQTICDSALDDELRYACDAMVLGCLMKSSRKIGIWPKPDAPFNGQKFKDLVIAIRNIRILDVCNKTSSRRWNSHGPSPNCHGLEDSIEASMKSIEAGLDGLKLSDFPKSSEDHSSVFQISLPVPSVKGHKSLSNEENGDDIPIYMTDHITEAPKKELKKAQVEFPAPPSGFSPRLDSPKVAESLEHQKQSIDLPINGTRAPLAEEVRASSRSVVVDESIQEGVKVGPTQYSQEVQPPKTPNSPKASLQGPEESFKHREKTSQRDSLSQKSESLAKASTNDVDGKSREVLKPAAQVISMNELFKTNSPPVKEIKPSTVDIKGKETPNGSQTTTEVEDAWTPPKNFKMKKSKKTFSTRY